ncbi:hypothetical protein [Halovulum sp. GXIMD14793]
MFKRFEFTLRHHIKSKRVHHIGLSLRFRIIFCLRFIPKRFKVLLADQGHAGRDGYGGMRASEIAGNYYKPLRFSVDCDGGSFDVIEQDAAGITIETSGFRLAVDGCIDERFSTTLAEEGSTSTKYRLERVEAKACDW